MDPLSHIEDIQDIAKIPLSSRAVAVSVQRQQRWAGIETALTASESDIETTSVVTVWLPQCQCRPSANSAEPTLAQRWRQWQYSRVRQQQCRVDGPTLPVLTSHQDTLSLTSVSQSWWVSGTISQTFPHTQNTYKQQINNFHLQTKTHKTSRKHAYTQNTTHKQSEQQDKITDRIQTPQRILEGFKASGGSEKRQFRTTFLISQIKIRRYSF